MALFDMAYHEKILMEQHIELVGISTEPDEPSLASKDALLS